MKQRTTLIRAMIAGFSHSVFGILLPKDAPAPQVLPLQYLGNGGDTKVPPRNAGVPLAQRDDLKNRIFGWEVNNQGPGMFSSDALYCGEVRWVGDGPEMVAGWICPPYDGHGTPRIFGILQLGIMRDLGNKPNSVTLGMRNDWDSRGYADATGIIGQRHNLATVGIEHCFATYEASVGLDDSSMSTKKPHALWAWRVQNEKDHFGRVCRITAS